MRNRAALLWLVLLLGLPSAAAHSEPFSEAASIRIGPYQASIDPRPIPLYANESKRYYVFVSDVDDGSLVKPESASLEFSDGQGPNETVALAYDENSGSHDGPLAWPRPGNLTAVLTIVVEGQTHRAPAQFHIYPDTPFRVFDFSSTQDAVVNQSYPLVFAVVHKTTRLPYTNVTDLRLRIQHWSDDHLRLLSTDHIDLRRGSDGRWNTSHTFRDPGMHHLNFRSASGNFTHGDTPLLHMWVLPTAAPTTQEGGRVSTPAGPLPLAVLATALAAVLARRRKGACDR